MSKALRIAGTCLGGLLLLGMSAWGVLALAYFDHQSAVVRTGTAVAFGLLSVAALVGFAIHQPRRWSVFGLYLALFGLLLWRWLALEPSNERAWLPEVAVLPYAVIDGDLVTVHNIRNFDYRSEADFTPGYYDKTFDFRDLDSVDLVASYWMGPHIAHLFVTFGFASRDYLAISIEARKEIGEEYSSVQGFFRKYELIYVVADERDVVRVRTNYRRDPPEDVYLYPMKGNRETARKLLLWYMMRINELRQRPEFYNALTTNCTTDIWTYAPIGGLPLSWKVLASGHVPELLQEIGRIDASIPFAALKQRSRINALAQAADTADDFSQRIRPARKAR